MTPPVKAHALTARLAAVLLTLAMTQALPPSSAQTMDVKVVYAGRLIDAVSDRVRTGVSVVIENGRVREVKEGRVTIPGAEVIDLGDSTVLPGLIDCHTHLTFEVSRGKTLKDLLLSRDSALAISAGTRPWPSRRPPSHVARCSQDSPRCATWGPRPSST